VELLELTLRLSAVEQPDLHVVRGWDGKQKQPIVARVTPESFAGEVLGVGLGAAVTAEAFSERRSVTMDQPLFSQNEAELLAEAEFKNRARSFIEGEGTCIGKAEMRAGDLVEIKGMGKRFSGEYFLTRVTHVIDEQGFRTHFAIERNGE
jgi:phage protein D